MSEITSHLRAIAQAVSRWLPTAAARVRVRDWSCGICGGQSGAGAGFLPVLRFPLPNFIPPTAPQSPSSIIWGLYNRPEMTAVPSGLSPTPVMIINKIIIIHHILYYIFKTWFLIKHWSNFIFTLDATLHTLCTGARCKQ
jgi:hypothetical protein